MKKNTSPIHSYIELDIFKKIHSADRINKLVPVLDLFMSLDKYGRDKVGEVVDELIEKQYIMERGGRAFGPGVLYYEWSEIMVPPKNATSNVYNVDNINGNVHFGVGDIKISSSDADIILELIKRLSSTSEIDSFGSKVKERIGEMLSAGANVSTILPAIAEWVKPLL